MHFANHGSERRTRFGAVARSTPMPSNARRSERMMSAGFRTVVRVGLLPVFVSGLLATAASAGPVEEITQSLRAYCIDCHGPDKQKGERRVDQLTFPLPDGDSAILAQEMVDQLVHGDMPPKKSEQPAEKIRLKLITQLRDQIRRYRESSESVGGETVLRRLNQREYRNTVRDLLRINMDMFDPTRNFPRDRTSHNFDNIGDALTTSGFLLERYLDAADQVVEKAFSPAEKPEVREWRFTAPFQQQPELLTPHRRAYDSRFLCIHEAINSDRHWGEYAPILKFKDGVPYQGRYEIELLLEGLNRDHPHPKSKVNIDKDEPMWLGVIPGNIKHAALHDPQPFEKVLARLEVPEGEPQWRKATVWLDKGYTPRFIWINGLSGARSLHSRIGLQMLKKEGRGNNPFGSHYVKTLKEGKLPHIRIHEIKIRGPIYDEWPPASRTAVLGEKPFAVGRTKAILRDFASRAFRREATGEELKRLMAVVDRRKAAGRDDLEALKDALKVVLCSPSFLFLDDNAAEDAGARADAVAYASRLSYLLWASMPDGELLAAAGKGDLSEPAALRRQVDRMLADPRSEAFYEGFLDSWLNLRELGGMPPDRRAFAVYYEKDLRPLMLRETRLFTRHLVEENLSLMNFVDSDFTFANKTLAQFYGLEPMSGYEFRKVALNDRSRGGLLGQAGVLTVTANGIETSPVTRGIWILENIFGRPPPPPPDDVEPLDPDVRGATTVRERLLKHRDTPACNDCHRKIDPPGFAMENFDPIGRWRGRYGTKREIDASGELPGGETFKDLVGFKRLVLQREEQFARMFVEKLLTYGAGRRIEATDRPEVDRIVAEAKKAGFGARDVLQLVVESPILRSR